MDATAGADPAAPGRGPGVAGGGVVGGGEGGACGWPDVRRARWGDRGKGGWVDDDGGSGWGGHGHCGCMREGLAGGGGGPDRRQPPIGGARTTRRTYVGC